MKDHDCRGEVCYEGIYRAFVTSKQNNSGTSLIANGKVRLCNQCGCNYALPTEGIYASENDHATH